VGSFLVHVGEKRQVERMERKEKMEILAFTKVSYSGRKVALARQVELAKEPLSTIRNSQGIETESNPSAVDQQRHDVSIKE
jgi:hypothetical protein